MFFRILAQCSTIIRYEGRQSTQGSRASFCWFMFREIGWRMEGSFSSSSAFSSSSFRLRNCPNEIHGLQRLHKSILITEFFLVGQAQSFSHFPLPLPRSAAGLQPVQIAFISAGGHSSLFADPPPLPLSLFLSGHWLCRRGAWSRSGANPSLWKSFGRGMLTTLPPLHSVELE